jgi:hypothetical protein
MSWKLTSSNLPSTEIVNNTTVSGLELLELGDYNLRAPLFRYALDFSPEKSAFNTSSSSVGEVTTTDTETILVPETVSKLYIIDSLWDIDSLEYVSSLNLLDSEKYTHYLDSTVFITNETTLDISGVFYAYAPNPDSAYTYVIDLSNSGLDIGTISKVEVEGLKFSTENGNLIYNSSVKTLILSASAYCRIIPGSTLEIYNSTTLSLDSFSNQTAYIFDLAALNLSYVKYIDYLGLGYQISGSLQSGTLINNYTEKKVIAIK